MLAMRVNKRPTSLVCSFLVLLGMLLGCMAITTAATPTETVLKPVIAGSTAWYNAKDWGVSGKGWEDTKAYYDRLPAKAEKTVPSAVWNLSHQSAGMYVEFETDSTTIHARWNLNNYRLAMPHMTAAGTSGVDLYVLNDAGKWQWIAASKPETFPKIDVQLISGMPAGYRKYRLYLPLYNGVTSVEIGVNNGSKFAPVYPSEEKPIVFYGTSITQGCSASRPGMAYTAILGRRLDVPVINLGFSGSGKMEMELAELLAELDPAIYVLDAIPNMDGDLVRYNFERFVRKLREVHPTTPIVVVEDRAYANTPYQPSRQTHHAMTRLQLRAAYNRLVESGVQGLHFVSRDGLFGDDYEGTVDGSHPTDVGMMRYSDILEPILRSLL